MSKENNPFIVHKTKEKLIAIKGLRKGYLQIAQANEETLNYADTSLFLFEAARAWAIELEKLGAKRVYWITLSEQVKHLHIHLYPRWLDSEKRGLELFSLREEETQEEFLWDSIMAEALAHWATKHNVFVKS